MHASPTNLGKEVNGRYLSPCVLQKNETSSIVFTAVLDWPCCRGSYLMILTDLEVTLICFGLSCQTAWIFSGGLREAVGERVNGSYLFQRYFFGFYFLFAGVFM